MSDNQNLQVNKQQNQIHVNQDRQIEDIVMQPVNIQLHEQDAARVAEIARQRRQELDLRLGKVADNMPVNYRAVTADLLENKKALWRSDNQQMRKVKNAIKRIERMLHKEYEGDMSDSFDTIMGEYDFAIEECRAYCRGHNPWTKEGKERKTQVRNNMERLCHEREVFKAAAKAYRGLDEERKQAFKTPLSLLDLKEFRADEMSGEIRGFASLTGDKEALMTLTHYKDKPDGPQMQEVKSRFIELEEFIKVSDLADESKTEQERTAQLNRLKSLWDNVTGACENYLVEMRNSGGGKSYGGVIRVNRVNALREKLMAQREYLDTIYNGLVSNHARGISLTTVYHLTENPGRTTLEFLTFQNEHMLGAFEAHGIDLLNDNVQEFHPRHEVEHYEAELPHEEMIDQAHEEKEKEERKSYIRQEPKVEQEEKQEEKQPQEVKEEKQEENPEEELPKEEDLLNKEDKKEDKKDEEQPQEEEQNEEQEEEQLKEEKQDENPEENREEEQHEEDEKKEELPKEEENKEELPKEEDNKEELPKEEVPAVEEKEEELWEQKVKGDGIYKEEIRQQKVMGDGLYKEDEKEKLHRELAEQRNKEYVAVAKKNIENRALIHHMIYEYYYKPGDLYKKHKKLGKNDKVNDKAAVTAYVTGLYTGMNEEDMGNMMDLVEKPAEKLSKEEKQKKAAYIEKLMGVIMDFDINAFEYGDVNSFLKKETLKDAYYISWMAYEAESLLAEYEQYMKQDESADDDEFSLMGGDEKITHLSKEQFAEARAKTRCARTFINGYNVMYQFFVGDNVDLDNEYSNYISFDDMMKLDKEELKIQIDFGTMDEDIKKAFEKAHFMKNKFPGNSWMPGGNVNEYYQSFRKAEGLKVEQKPVDINAIDDVEELIEIKVQPVKEKKEGRKSENRQEPEVKQEEKKQEEKKKEEDPDDSFELFREKKNQDNDDEGFGIFDDEKQEEERKSEIVQEQKVEEHQEKKEEERKSENVQEPEINEVEIKVEAEIKQEEKNQDDDDEGFGLFGEEKQQEIKVEEIKQEVPHNIFAERTARRLENSQQSKDWFRDYNRNMARRVYYNIIKGVNNSGYKDMQKYYPGADEYAGVSKVAYPLNMINRYNNRSIEVGSDMVETLQENQWDYKGCYFRTRIHAIEDIFLAMLKCDISKFEYDGLDKLVKGEGLAEVYHVAYAAYHSEKYLKEYEELFEHPEKFTTLEVKDREGRQIVEQAPKPIFTKEELKEIKARQKFFSNFTGTFNAIWRFYDVSQGDMNAAYVEEDFEKIMFSSAEELQQRIDNEQGMNSTLKSFIESVIRFRKSNPDYPWTNDVAVKDYLEKLRKEQGLDGELDLDGFINDIQTRWDQDEKALAPEKEKARQAKKEREGMEKGGDEKLKARIKQALENPPDPDVDGPVAREKGKNEMLEYMKEHSVSREIEKIPEGREAFVSKWKNAKEPFTVVVPDKCFMNDPMNTNYTFDGKADPDAELFPGGRVSLAGVKQGSNTCYFTAPIIGLIDSGNGEKIKEMVKDFSPTQASVRLYDENGVPVCVVVDKTRSANDDRPLWQIMIEKAAAVFLNKSGFKDGARKGGGAGHAKNIPWEDLQKDGIPEGAIKIEDTSDGNEDLGFQLLLGKNAYDFNTRSEVALDHVFCVNNYVTEGDEAIGRMMALLSPENKKLVLASTCTEMTEEMKENYLVLNPGYKDYINNYNREADAVPFNKELDLRERHVYLFTDVDEESQQFRTKDPLTGDTKWISFKDFRQHFTDVRAIDM